jgi:hypothetical protein
VGPHPGVLNKETIIDEMARWRQDHHAAILVAEAEWPPGDRSEQASADRTDLIWLIRWLALAPPTASGHPAASGLRSAGAPVMAAPRIVASRLGDVGPARRRAIIGAGVDSRSARDADRKFIPRVWFDPLLKDNLAAVQRLPDHLPDA